MALVMRDKRKIRSVSFTELWRKVDSFSFALRNHSMQTGDRIILMIPMSLDLYIALLGIIKMGGVAIFVDPWINYKQIADFCLFAEPRGYIGVGKSHLLRFLKRELIRIHFTVTTGKKLLGFPAKYSFPVMLSCDGDGEIFRAEGSDPALITFTSGSSGIPKGANRTHGFLSAQHKALEDEFSYKTEDVDMPMFPVFALNNIAAGRTSIIPDMDFKNVAQVNPEIIAGQIEYLGVTTCTASPPFIDRLADYILECRKKPIYLRRILTGGAPVSDKQLDKWRSAFPDTDIQIIYGSTEAEPVAHISLKERLEIVAHDEGKNTGFCAGTPVSRVEAKTIKILKGPIDSSLSWEGLETDDNEIGELIISGDHVCRDYFNNPDAVRENKIIDPQGKLWHRMGDTGIFDSSGRFWLAGRVHSTIVRNDQIFHAQIVEQAVKEALPEAKQVAAVGIPDTDAGERLIIAVFLHQRIEKKSIYKRLKKTQCGMDDVVIMKYPLPVDPRHNSKIDYCELRKRIVQIKGDIK